VRRQLILLVNQLISNQQLNPTVNPVGEPTNLKGVNSPVGQPTYLNPAVSLPADTHLVST